MDPQDPNFLARLKWFQFRIAGDKYTVFSMDMATANASLYGITNGPLVDTEDVIILLSPPESYFLSIIQHRTRIYFLDGTGTEWEFVEYLSEDPAERNDYSL